MTGVGMKLITVSERGCELRELKPCEGNKVELNTIERYKDVVEACWSQDGTRIAMLDALKPGVDQSIRIYSADDMNMIYEMKSKKQIRRFALSNHGNFLMYCIAREDQDTEKNFFCLQIGYNIPIVNVPLKDYSQTWPNFKISDNETYAVRAASESVIIYELPQVSDNLDCTTNVHSPTESRKPAGTAIDEGEPFARIPVDKQVKCFAVSNEVIIDNKAHIYVSYFGQTKRGIHGPSQARVVCSAKPDKIISSALMHAEGGRMSFLSDGSAALFEAFLKEEKKETTSYYGKSTLHSLGAKSMRKIDLVGAMNQPVHACESRPESCQLMVSYGPTPAKLRLMDGFSGREIGNFGENQRNHFRFSPCGNWLLMGGYGALNGDTEIYDCGTGDVIGAQRLVNNVVADWFEDGKHLVLATTSPRLRVDNKLMIMRYNCEILFTENYERLTAVMVRPIKTEEAKIRYPPFEPTHTPMKNYMDGTQSYIPPSQRRKMEEQKKSGNKKAKAKAKKGAVIKTQGAKAKIKTSTVSAVAVPVEEEAPKIGFELPF